MRREFFDILCLQKILLILCMTLSLKSLVGNRKERIENMASICYGWVLEQTAMYDHPRYHFWHYRITFQFIGQ